MFKKSFSLLEIVIVVFIISLISLLSVSGLRSYYKKIAIKEQQEQINTSMLFGREEGETLLTNVVLYFKGGKYEIYRDSDLLDVINLNKDFRTSEGKLGFTNQGTTRYAGTIYLLYKNDEVSKLILAPGIGQWRWENI